MKYTFLTVTIVIIPLGLYSINFYDTLHLDTIDAYVYSPNNHQLVTEIQKSIQPYGIQLHTITSLDPNNTAMHLVFDIDTITPHQLPPHYIIVKTPPVAATRRKRPKAKLKQKAKNTTKPNPITVAAQSIYEKALAIWDLDWESITTYREKYTHYYHLNMERIDPLILPFFLPQPLLGTYREMLKYSNTVNSDISSHLPALFAHTVMHSPNIFIEVGVRGGESTKAFKYAIQHTNARLIGIDINPEYVSTYANLNIPHSEFHLMDDVTLPNWWQTSPYKDTYADIIFIDTSHYYEHTCAEIKAFTPLLANDGMLMFHDTTLWGGIYERLNNTVGGGWDNSKGVIRAIKEFFSIEFDESKYTLLTFVAHNSGWHLVHYPFCNGLTIIKKNPHILQG